MINLGVPSLLSRERSRRIWPQGRRRFRHVIATRFGIGIADPAWFDARLSLFEIVTAASIRAQTSQDFDWCVVIGRDMPADASARLQRILSGLPNAHTLTCRYRVDFEPALRKLCARLCAKSKAGYLMTTRLDDDDALAVAAVATLQRAASSYLEERRSQHRAVFSFAVGFDWIPWNNHALRRYHHSLGIGLSLLEPAANPELVYGHPHKQLGYNLARGGAHIEIFGGSGSWWLYTAHHLSDSNKGDASRIKRIEGHHHRLTLDAPLLARFGLDAGRLHSLRSLDDVKAARPLYRLSVAPLSLETELRRLRQEMKAGTADRAGRKDLQQRIAALEKERLAFVQGLVAR